MAHYNFEKDLADGKLAEQEVKLLLAAYFKVPVDDVKDNNTKEYDLRIASQNLFFEVKNDLMANKTGNVAVEYESRGKPSGLAVSTAGHWVYKFSRMYYLFTLQKLKEELFEKKNYHKKVSGGDPGSNTKLFLIKVTEFINWGTRL